MQKILRIDMGAEGGPAVREEPVGNYHGLGGRAMTSTIVSSEVPPLCHPLGAENKFVIAPGLLGGTPASMTERVSIGFKSPLTGGIKESNAGGPAGKFIARLGYAAIVLEGKPMDENLYKVVINKDGVEVIMDNTLKMMGNYQLVGTVIKEYSDKLACISIGPAGEMKMSAASVACTDSELDPTRHAGRGGGGAVMGSKGVKVIILDAAGTGSVIAREKKKFAEACKIFTDGLSSHPAVRTAYAPYGTSNMVDVVNNTGAFPTRNFSIAEYEDADKINAIALTDLEKKRGGEVTHGCTSACIIRCSGVYNDVDGDYVTKQPEYETIWAHGAACCIDDLDAIAQLDQLDDDYGLDTIEIGNAIAVAMEAGIIPFGDAQGAIDLVDEVGKGTPMGRILGAGAEVVGKVFGVRKVATVKGQALPAYDPRVLQGLGITFATSPMGADHTAGFVFASVFDKQGNLDPDKLKQQKQLSLENQIAHAAIDSTGMCQFVKPAIVGQPETFQAMLDMINALYGWEWTVDDYNEMGRSVLRKEMTFNRAAGLTSRHDRLPWFFRKEPVEPHGVTFQIDENDLDTIFDEE